jgi:putative inorganic carbon (HCO3(-)) transporter
MRSELSSRKMNNSIQLPKNYRMYFIITGFILVLNYALWKSDGMLLKFCIAFVSLTLLFYVITFAKNFLFPAILVLVPVSTVIHTAGGVAFDFPSEIVIGILALAYIIQSISKPTIYKSVLLHPVTILLFSELIWMLVTSVSSSEPMVSFKRCFVRFSYLIVFYLIATNWFSNQEKRKWIFLLYGIGLVIPVIHTLIIHGGYGFVKEAAYAMPQPFYADHTVYGAALAFILPALFIFLFNQKIMIRKGPYLIGFVLLLLLVLIGEIFSFSRAAWISLIVTILFFFLTKLHVRTWMLILGLTIVGSAVFIYRDKLISSEHQNEAVSNKGTILEHVESVTNLQTDASNLERINRWMSAIRMSEERPILGFGPGTYQFEYGRFQLGTEMTRISTFRGNRGHAHSEFFNALSETGFPGMILVIVIMFTVIHYGLRVVYRSKNKTDRIIALSAILGLITFYVHGFFNAFMDSDKMVSLIYGSIALLVVMDLQQKKERTLKNQDSI